jgi:hypothetical protein
MKLMIMKQVKPSTKKPPADTESLGQACLYK